MAPTPDAGTLAELDGLRRRADEDYLQPAADREGGRHQLDVPELGVRVSVTRARYPNRADGVDQYAITLSRSRLDRPASESEVRSVLSAVFGVLADDAKERTSPVSLVRMFRVRAAVGVGADKPDESARTE